MANKARKRATTHVRVSTDLAVKLSAVARHEYQNTADILDPVIRQVIEERFAALPSELQERALARVAGVRTPAPAP